MTVRVQVCFKRHTILLIFIAVFKNVYEREEAVWPIRARPGF